MHKLQILKKSSLIIAIFSLLISMCEAVDVSQYYKDDYIEEIVRSGKKDAVLLVTSWSGSGLEYPRSLNIGCRQSRDLPYNLVYAQRLKARGIKLKIYYLAFDNTQHFNHKDKRSVDNTISKAYINYITNLSGEPPLDDDQFEPIYLNPRYRTKPGDLIEPGLPVVTNTKGESLYFTGENAVLLRDLKYKVADHKKNGHLVIGMTSHAGGRELDELSNYLGTKMIGSSPASLRFGTKAGNKRLFEKAGVPYIAGSNEAQKEIRSLLADGVRVYKKTGAKKLIIKLNSSSAGKGNVDVDISKIKSDQDIKDAMLKSMQENMHPEKDKDLRPGYDNFYIRKLKELGAIVEEKLEGKKILSPATIAVVRSDGSVEVEYVYDQILTGSMGQNFGGSIGPTELGDDDKKAMIEYSIKIGEAFAKEGGRGYFGVDFLKCDDDLRVVEANIRATGTKRPQIMSLMLGIRDRTLFHDDNIKIPIGICDITGRQEELNAFMDELFKWLPTQSFHYNYSTKTGAIVTFETHTAGKLGVLFVGKDRDEVREIRRQFEEGIKEFVKTVYPSVLLRTNVQGLDLTQATHLMASDVSGTTFMDMQKPRGLVVGAVTPYERRSRLSLIVPYAVGKFDHFITTLSHTSRCTGPRKSMPYQADISKLTKIMADAKDNPFRPYDKVLAGRSKIRPLVFAIFGRTKTSDEILIEAAKRGIKAYRMDENSDFTFNENTREGFVRGVSAPKLIEKNGTWKMVADSTTEFELPTVVYDYDFTASRKMFYHSRGDQIMVDKNATVKEFLDNIGAIRVNEDEADSRILPASRSQLSLYSALKNHAPELCTAYPKTLPLIAQTDQEVKTFLGSADTFFIKPVLAERRPDPFVGNIFVRKSKDLKELNLGYFARVQKEGRSTLVLRKVRIDAKDLCLPIFRSLIDHVKLELGFSPDVQFLIQKAFQPPLVYDKAKRPIVNKIRVATQHNPDTREHEIIATSIYGIYGSTNAYYSYVGDPNIHVDAYLKQSVCEKSRENLYLEIFKVAERVHKAIEGQSKRRIGELVTDILLTSNGSIIPLKSKTKPERLDLDTITKQTHFGEYLEGSSEQRTTFVNDLRENEKMRTDLLIKEVCRLHNEEFCSLELQRKATSTFVPLIPGVPMHPEFFPIFAK